MQSSPLRVHWSRSTSCDPTCTLIRPNAAGAGVPVPGHSYEGQKWKEVRHDRTVTWLAFWKDPISDNQYKYVWLAANSAFKASADQEKYEKARKLKVSWCLP